MGSPRQPCERCADVNWKPSLRTRCNYWLRDYHCNVAAAAVCVLFNFLGEEFSITLFPSQQWFFHCYDCRFFCCSWLCRFATALKLNIDLTLPFIVSPFEFFFRRSEIAKWHANRIALRRSNLSLFQQFPRKPRNWPLHWFWFYFRL